MMRADDDIILASTPIMSMVFNATTTQKGVNSQVGVVQNYYNGITDPVLNTLNFPIASLILPMKGPAAIEKDPGYKIEYRQLCHGDTQIINAESASKGHYHIASGNKQCTENKCRIVIGVNNGFNQMLKCVPVGDYFQMLVNWLHVYCNCGINNEAYPGNQAGKVHAIPPCWRNRVPQECPLPGWLQKPSVRNP